MSFDIIGEAAVPRATTIPSVALPRTREETLRAFLAGETILNSKGRSWARNADTEAAARAELAAIEDFGRGVQTRAPCTTPAGGANHRQRAAEVPFPPRARRPPHETREGEPTPERAVDHQKLHEQVQRRGSPGSQAGSPMQATAREGARPSQYPPCSLCGGPVVAEAFDEDDTRDGCLDCGHRRGIQPTPIPSTGPQPIVFFFGP